MLIIIGSEVGRSSLFDLSLHGVWTAQITLTLWPFLMGIYTYNRSCSKGSKNIYLLQEIKLPEIVNKRKPSLDSSVIMFGIENVNSSFPPLSDTLPHTEPWSPAGEWAKPGPGGEGSVVRIPVQHFTPVLDGHGQSSKSKHSKYYMQNKIFPVGTVSKAL